MRNTNKGIEERQRERGLKLKAASWRATQFQPNRNSGKSNFIWVAQNGSLCTKLGTVSVRRRNSESCRLAQCLSTQRGGRLRSARMLNVTNQHTTRVRSKRLVAQQHKEHNRLLNAQQITFDRLAFYSLCSVLCADPRIISDLWHFLSHHFEA